MGIDICLYVDVYAMCLLCAYRGQNGVSDLLELELDSYSHHVGAGN